MKDWWKLQSTRINALSLRERVFLFISIMACIALVVDQFWLGPAQLRQKQVAARYKQQDTELRALRESLQAYVLKGPQGDPNQALKAELTQAGDRLNDVNAQLKALSLDSGGNANTALQALLVQLLRKYDGLSLVRTATLGTDAGQPTAQAAAPAASAAASAPAAGSSGGEVVSRAMPSLVRKNLEVTVAGAYGDLMRFVEALERGAPYLRWGPMKLVADGANGAASTQLTLQLSLLGVAP